MRKLALALCSTVPLLVGAVPAFADNGPHFRGAGPIADTCAGCHRTHTAKAPRLLKQPQNTLCFTCHDGTGASTDAKHGVRSGGPVSGLRGGGFEDARIDSANPTGQGRGQPHFIPVRSTSQSTTSTHSIDGSTQTAWGNGAISSTPDYGRSVQLTCGSCHDPHGNGQYRILRPIPRDSGAEDPGVEIPDTATKVYTVPGTPPRGNYWFNDDPNAPGYLANISAWCSTCHTRYNAPSGSGRTPSGDAVFSYRHRADADDTDHPNCATCHVAHGGNSSQGRYSREVPWPNGTSAGTDSRLLKIDNRGVCQMCHNK